MKNNQPVVLFKITEKMRENCPIDEMRCFECLSQACKPGPLDEADLSDLMPEDEEDEV